MLSCSLRLAFSGCWRAVCSFRAIPLLLLLALAACGTLPRPFEGNPGATARKLVQPPSTKLVVDRPDAGVLPPGKADLFATALADALASQDVPAVSAGGLPSDWHIHLNLQRGEVALLPLFVITDEKGEQAGVAQGQPITAAVWAQGQVETLRKVATDAAPDIAGLLTRIEASRRAADPNSLINRTTKVFVPRVTGAPGDGNDQLTRQIKAALVAQSLIVDPASGDFTIAGQVAVVKLPGGKTDRVEIQWVISDPRGERGRVVQLNEIQSGLLDRNWGDVAVVVAEEAAAGIKDVVARQVGTSSK